MRASAEFGMDVGLYGKLPSHGDFLRRRVSDAFVDAWDTWLRECLATSRSVLGARWLEIYLTSPVWRFICAPGACGPAAVVGVIAPSVDRVGRYFPLTLVAELPESVSLLGAATAAAAFFDRAERLVIDTLAADDVDFDHFDEGVVGLGNELAVVGISPRVVIDPAAAALFSGGAQNWQPIGSADQLGSVFEQLLSLRLSVTYDPMVLWWTEGSAVVDPSCLIVKGLPHPTTFAALLDGAWAQHHWRSIPAQVEADVSTEDTLLTEVPLRFRSAAATDVGRARGNNEDGFLERPETGLWAVADGMGGHRDGEVASRMVCDALADFEPIGSFEETVEGACQRLLEVNDQLLRTAARLHPEERSGSTVVVLVARGARSAILWAGDSRVYRWRDGLLEQLSRDHSLAAVDELAGSKTSNIVTRAVGVEPRLELDVERDTVRADDRFLLCSDGLTKVVSEDEIRRCLQQQDVRVATDSLIATTLDAGAPDNVTVVIVEAYL